MKARNIAPIDTLAAAARAMGYDLEVRLVKRDAAQRRVAEEGGEYEGA